MISTMNFTAEQKQFMVDVVHYYGRDIITRKELRHYRHNFGLVSSPAYITKNTACKAAKRGSYQIPMNRLGLASMTPSADAMKFAKERAARLANGEKDNVQVRSKTSADGDRNEEIGDSTVDSNSTESAVAAAPKSKGKKVAGKKEKPAAKAKKVVRKKSSVKEESDDKETSIPEISSKKEDIRKKIEQMKLSAGNEEETMMSDETADDGSGMNGIDLPEAA